VRIAVTTGAPKVRFGTKWPSIMSTGEVGSPLVGVVVGEAQGEAREVRLGDDLCLVVV